MRTILQRIASKDTDAIGACLDEYGDLVWRLASRYLDRESGDVEDAVQEVFVEVWLSAGKFDPAKGTEAAYIATIAHRRLTDYQRRLSVRRRVSRPASSFAGALCMRRTATMARLMSARSMSADCVRRGCSVEVVVCVMSASCQCDVSSSSAAC